MTGDPAIRSLIAIATITGDDETGWRRLWNAYLRFYRVPLANEVTACTWRRVVAGDCAIYAVGAKVDGRLVGFAHFVHQATTWSIEATCYLHDLFVEQGFRGRGVARALIGEVSTRASQAGCRRLHWLTQEDNTDARSIYDTLASRTPFVQYVREL